MYIITCVQHQEDKKLVHDEVIKYEWGENLFDAVVFNTVEEAVEFIKNEPRFVEVQNNRKPYLLNDIDINSVCITKIDEVIYKNISLIKFDGVLKKIK